MQYSGATLPQYGDNRLPSRFWGKVAEPDVNGCWIWIGTPKGNGYGTIRWQGKNVLSHRLAYQELSGPVTTGLQLDHLCRNRACVNPGHLEAVTNRENAIRGCGPTAINARKTHCANGHTYNAPNTIIRSTGGRKCRACANVEQRRRYASRNA